ncbi:hypothetical protein AWB78_05624 [Caballeronia calidae]|uniref:Uncharacterized protein n=1 Tax=Caballeronia calidae TaxID=1777139 RepID=A0A158DUC9_9BURK|nr:hypothetical protein [Caballeronia calidae]SAK98164.1 hypothetical protein AWB78_05624 [Caballeronia calidae]
MLITLYEAGLSETAFSLATATADTTFSPRIRQIVTTVFRRGNPLLHTAPCRIGQFCDLTNRLYGEPRQVLMERTLYPLFMSCLTASLAQRLEWQVCSTDQPRLCCPSLPLPLQSANRYGLECKECTALSLQATGRRCSFTFHCIPLLTRCAIHDTALTLADPCSAHEINMRVLDERSRRSNSLRLGKILYRMYQSAKVQSAVEDVRILIRERGYVPEHGRLRAKDFSNDFLAFFSDGFEDERIIVWIRELGMLSPALRSLLYDDRPAHPVAVALLRMALDVIACKRPTARLRAPKQVDGRSSPPNEVERRAKRTLWEQHLARGIGLTRTQARLAAPALWRWLNLYDHDWLLAHQVPPLPKSNGGRRIQCNDAISSLVKASLRDACNPTDADRPKWKYRARISCGLTQRVFDRLVKDRP